MVSLLNRNPQLGIFRKTMCPLWRVQVPEKPY
jgi:hypothetical protein